MRRNTPLIALTALIAAATGARAADLATVDGDWLAAVGTHDAPAVARSLHADARWTTVEGRTLGAAEIGMALPQPLVSNAPEAELDRGVPGARDRRGDA